MVIFLVCYICYIDIFVSIEGYSLLCFRFFNSHEDLKKLFYRLMVKTESGEEIDPEKLRTHGTVVMQGLGAAVESLDDSVFLSNILIAVGDRHAKYNVNPEMITVS